MLNHFYLDNHLIFSFSDDFPFSKTHDLYKKNHRELALCMYLINFNCHCSHRSNVNRKLKVQVRKKKE